MTGEVERRELRGEVARLNYEGPESVQAASDLRAKVAAAAELARRAGADEVSWMLTAREAERSLGRMLIAGREAGEVIPNGRGTVDRTDSASLADLGIPRDLAADAVALASVPDKVWSTWLVEVDGNRSRASQRTFVRAARTFLDSIERATRDAERAQREAEAAAEEARALERRLHDAVLIAPLLESETSMNGAAEELTAAASRLEPEPGPPARDESPEALMQVRLVQRMTDLRRAVEAHDPVLTNDVWRGAHVYGAREAVRELTGALAIWMRMLNALWEEEVRS
jgi:hypothetical protein